jgi:hypothetical protein
MDRDGDSVVSKILAHCQRLWDVDDTQPRFVVHCRHLRGAPINKQPG